MWYLEDKYKLFLIFLLLCITCSAQYHPQYSQYMFNGLAINPAYAGSREALNVAALYRSSQWGKSVEGAPVTQTLAGDFPLLNPQVALGLMIFNDKIHTVGHTGAYFAYAYRVVAGAGKLSFGLQAGIDVLHDDHTIHIGKLVDDGDPMFSLDGKFNIFMPNFGVGTYYYTSNFFAGLSLPQLLTYTPTTAKEYKGKLTLANTILYGGVIVPAGNLKLKPSTMLQYVGSGLLWDINCNFLLLQERLELGLSYRSSGVLVSMAQFRINQLRIGYAYDYGIGKPTAINTTHEILLRYDLNFNVRAVSPLDFF